MRLQLITFITLTAAVSACTSPVFEQDGAHAAADSTAPAFDKVVAERSVLQSAAAREPTAPVQMQDSVAPSMIIRNGNATVAVAKIDDAIAALRNLAQRFGGYVTNTSMLSGRDQVPSASIELKIPAARFDSALAGLSPLGRVESVNTTAEDVGEHFVDMTARLANARRLEERIQAILATRTGKLEDVIAAERELARVREEIERYEGRLRFLRTRLALSTLTVNVHEPYPVVGGPGTGPIAQAFKNMWRNFVLFLAWLIASLGWMLPVGAIAVGAWLGVRRYMRRRRVSSAPATA